MTKGEWFEGMLNAQSGQSNIGAQQAQANLSQKTNTQQATYLNNWMGLSSGLGQQEAYPWQRPASWYEPIKIPHFPTFWERVVEWFQSLFKKPIPPQNPKTQEDQDYADALAEIERTHCWTRSEE